MSKDLTLIKDKQITIRGHCTEKSCDRQKSLESTDPTKAKFDYSPNQTKQNIYMSESRMFSFNIIKFNCNV